MTEPRPRTGPKESRQVLCRAAKALPHWLLAMGKGDGKWKKGEGPSGPGPGNPGGPGGPGAWKGIAKWGGKADKGNWISQPEDGPDMKRQRLDALGPAFSLKGRDGKGKDGIGKGYAPGLAKGMAMQPEKPDFGCFGGKGEAAGHSDLAQAHLGKLYWWSLLRTKAWAAKVPGQQDGFLSELGAGHTFAQSEVSSSRVEICAEWRLLASSQRVRNCISDCLGLGACGSLSSPPRCRWQGVGAQQHCLPCFAERCQLQAMPAI